MGTAEKLCSMPINAPTGSELGASNPFLITHVICLDALHLEPQGAGHYKHVHITSHCSCPLSIVAHTTHFD